MSTWFLDSELSTCLKFKTALYSSALVMKLLNVVLSQNYYYEPEG